MGDPGLLLQDQLRVPRDPGREVRRQRDRLVQRVGVERLRPAKRRAHRLVGGADDVVVGVLFLKAHARGLAVRSQHEARLLLRAEIRHDPVPQQPRGAQLRDLHEEVHADGEEERQAAREVVDVHPCRHRGADVFTPVGQRVGQFLHQVRARFLHVVAGNRDRVEPGHLRRGVADDVGDDPHRRLGRIDVGVADHELLENVVLDRPRQDGAGMALLLARDDEAGEDRDHRAVHGHRHRHLVQRDAVEQDLHVLDAVDGNPRLAHVAFDPRMIAVIAPVRREIERDRHALLPGGEIAAVERVRFLGRRKARILPDRPRAARIHRRARAAGEGRDAGQAAHVIEVLGVCRGIKRLDLDAFQRVPGERIGFRALQFLACQFAPQIQRRLGVVHHVVLSGRARVTISSE